MDPIVMKPFPPVSQPDRFLNQTQHIVVVAGPCKGDKISSHDKIRDKSHLQTEFLNLNVKVFGLFGPRPRDYRS